MNTKIKQQNTLAYILTKEVRESTSLISGRKLQLTLENKILLYKSIMKTICTHGMQIRGTAAKSYLEILQRLQNKVIISA